MVTPLVSPSALLSEGSELKAVASPVGGGRLCGANFRRSASGSLSINKVRLSPTPQEGQARTWFEADEALVRSDLSSIKGAGRVRLAIGSLSFEGESFTLLPEKNLFLLNQVVLRSRDPMLRLTASRLRANFQLDPKSGMPAIESFELIGAIEGSVVIPWNNESRKFDFTAGRVAIDWNSDHTRATITGRRAAPIQFKSRDGLIDVQSDTVRLTYNKEKISCEGLVEGLARLSGAALFQPDERTTFHISKTTSFDITASGEQQPLWWSGGRCQCAFDRLTIRDAACRNRSLGAQLVLQDPGFAPLS